MGGATGPVYGATGAVRTKEGTVFDATAVGGVVLAIESVCDTVGVGHKPMCAR